MTLEQGFRIRDFGGGQGLNQSDQQNGLLRAYIYLVLSLSAHALIWLVILQSDLILKHLPQSEILFSENKNNSQVEIVLLEDSPNPISKPDTKASFQAQKTQRVQEQTQARFRGLTENKEFPSRPRPIQQATQEQQESITQEKSDIDLKATDRLNRALATGISTLSESMPQDIKFGDFTALNTDQYLYFSFFNRIAPRIRFNWENGVASVVEELSLRHYQLNSKKTFTTEVEVRLDSSGYLQGVSIHRSSGIPGLDQAVARAFQLSTPFINPPAEMVKPDGLIRLYYGFNVHFEPSLFARP